MAWFVFVGIRNTPDLEPRPIQLPRVSAYTPYLDDFLVFYSAGVMARAEPESVYDTERSRHFQAAQSNQDERFVSILPFFNPPGALLLFSAVSLLPLATAAVLWLVLTFLLSLVVSLAVLRERIRGREPFDIILWCLGVAVSLPFYQVMFHGQLTFLLVAGSGLVWLGVFEARRPGLAVTGLATLAFKPVLLLPFLTYLVVMRRWRELGLLLLVEGTLTLTAMILFNMNLLASYLELGRSAASWDEVNGISTYFMFGWTGFVRGLWGVQLQHVRFVVVAVLNLLTLAVVALAQSRPLAWSGERRFAATMTAALLISAHSYAQDLLLLALPLALLVTQRDEGPKWALVSLACWFALYLHFPALLSTGVGTASLALVVLLGVLLWRTFAHKRIRGELLLTEV